MATSFKKKGARSRVAYPAGTRASLHNNQLLVSTGIPSMDNVIGGGLAVGTVLLIEEDTFGSYARQMLKYFLAEGVVSRHGIFLASAEYDPSALLKDLPKVIGGSVDEKSTATHSGEESMKIAWRYQNLPKFQSNPSHAQFGHYFDLTQVMDEDQVMQSGKVDTFSVLQEAEHEPTASGENSVYQKLLSSIKSVVDQGQYCTSANHQQQERTILRVALHGLGSALWGGSSSSNNSSSGSPDVMITRFLYSLRAILRSSLAVCLVTAPTHLFQDASLARRVERLCDTVVSLEAFSGSDQETNPAYKDYHGLFHIVRVPRLNSLTCHAAESQELAFKLRRKKLVIEKLHLPPDLSETASRTQLDAVTGRGAGLGTMACQSHNSQLDF